ncbi:hypothetical protein BDZ89DRAFT_95066 [Hymenopellis radicata]|nr:hypothetical protein BDZ89DRAFT_95066 [Hymenopellis radicata]
MHAPAGWRSPSITTMTQQHPGGPSRGDSFHPDKHREALRLALGSILSPKRPMYSRSTSTSTSGTASPFPPHHVPPPPHPSPLPDHHAHTSSRLANADPNGSEHHDDHHHDHDHSSTAFGEHLTVPRSPSAEPGTITPNRAKFIETLQSKSAWDALIHGSFS